MSRREWVPVYRYSRWLQYGDEHGRTKELKVTHNFALMEAVLLERVAKEEG